MGALSSTRASSPGNVIWVLGLLPRLLAFGKHLSLLLVHVGYFSRSEGVRFAGSKGGRAPVLVGEIRVPVDGSPPRGVRHVRRQHPHVRPGLGQTQAPHRTLQAPNAIRVHPGLVAPAPLIHAPRPRFDARRLVHPPVRVLALPAAVVRHVAPRAPLEEHAVLLRPRHGAFRARGVPDAVPPPRRHERGLGADHLLAAQVGLRSVRLQTALVPVEPEVVVAVALGERGSAEAILHRVSPRGDAEVGREGLVVAARLHE
mmetsp:Transcript_509/g.1905  ORF Transcript_509/g.1905 Transcript_509/m.1905 type:complete len:258 (-) Transcript_509:514-1287(-)